MKWWQAFVRLGAACGHTACCRRIVVPYALNALHGLLPAPTDRLSRAQCGCKHMDFWLSDGIYGSLNCIQRDHAELLPHVLRSPLLPAVSPVRDPSGAAQLLIPSTLFGPTCDGADQLVADYPLPPLRNGDWVLFPRMGAYTWAGACAFNGFDVTKAVKFLYVCSAR